MDLSADKERLRYSHRLEIWRIVVEKLLLGVLLIIIGLLANLLFENFKDHLSQERFILEKKLSSVKDVRAAFDKLHSTFLAWTVDECRNIPSDYSERYDTIVNEFINSANVNTLLLSEEFSNFINYVLWIYQGFYYFDISKAYLYREYAAHINSMFENACKREVGIELNPQLNHFQLKGVSWAEAERLGALLFMEMNYLKWKSWKDNIKKDPYE